MKKSSSLFRTPHNRLAIIGVILVVAVSIGLVKIFLFSGPIPRQYRSGLQYDLYYPKQLPDGYTVNPASFRRKGKVLIFTLTSPHSPTIAVSEEALPIGLNLNQTNPSGIQLPTNKDFTTAIGQASLSLWGTNTVVSIQASGTWLILNVTGVQPQTAIAVGSSFRSL